MRRHVEPVPVNPTVESPLNIARLVPSFFLKAPDGATYSMPLGQPTVLFFYQGGWSEYSQKDLTALQGILPDVKELGATIVGISTDNAEEIVALKERMGITMTLLSDTDFKATDIFGLRHKGARDSTGADIAYPTTFVLDKSGVVRAKLEVATNKDPVDPQAIMTSLKRALRR